MKRNLITGISAGLFAIVLTSTVIIYLFSKKVACWKAKNNDLFDVEGFMKSHGSFSPKRYSYSNVRKMTRAFSEKIGQGGFGAVYKGKLPDKTVVAVKVLKESNKSNGEDFINEVASIGRTSHINVVTLLGFCYERNKRALIYEYLPNGSLDKFIFSQDSSLLDKNRLPWKTLYEISMGLEMVGGRKNIDAEVSRTSEIYFPHWIHSQFETSDKLELGEEIIGNAEDEEMARKMILVGLWCVQTIPSDRPSMSKVVEMLEGSVLSIEIPPKPTLSVAES